MVAFLSDTFDLHDVNKIVTINIGKKDFIAASTYFFNSNIPF